MPPTAAIGLAMTSEEPVATAAFNEVELVIIPQPMLTSVLPVALMPVTARVLEADDAIFAGWDDCRGRGGPDGRRRRRNSDEKPSRFCTARVTRTAMVIAGIGTGRRRIAGRHGGRDPDVIVLREVGW